MLFVKRLPPIVFINRGLFLASQVKTAQIADAYRRGRKVDSMHFFGFGSAKDPIRAVLSALCFLLLSVLLSQSAHAQNAAVSGLVTDSSGALVPNVQVTLTNERTGIAQHSKTDGKGLYSLPFVQPGQYTLSAEFEGFKRFEQKSITVSTAQNLTLDVKLQVGSNRESVTVDGSAIQINTVDAAVTTVVDSEFVENEPLNGRTLQSLLTLVPGVSLASNGNMTGTGRTGEITVDGQRTEANYFTVDGVSATTGVQTQGTNVGYGFGYAGVLPSTTVLGTTQSLVSLDALEEFKAATSTYGAEYGRSPGGQFSLTSRSGTNHWHGSAFDYLRNDALDANNWFNDYLHFPKQVERQNDFGGTLGGPLTIPGLYNGENRTFFFFSYEGLRLTMPISAQVYDIPSLSLRQNAPDALKPFLNAFPLPLPTSKDLGDGLVDYTMAYSSQNVIDAPSIRIDHIVNSRLKLFGRFSDTASSTSSTSLSELSSTNNSVKSLTTGAIGQITSHVTNDFRFNYTASTSNSNQRLTSDGGATPVNFTKYPGMYPTSLFDFGLCWDQCNGWFVLDPQFVHQNQINIVNTISTTRGRHNLKAGIDYRRLSNAQSFHRSWAIPYYMNAGQILANAPQWGEIGVSKISYMRPIYSNFSAFVQDEWRATPRLSLSLGLRWEVNPPPSDADRNNDPYTVNQVSNLATTTLAPVGTALWKTTYTNFAPRIGAAYQLHESPNYQTVLRVGAGLYFDEGNTFASLGYIGIGYSGSAVGDGTPFPFTQQQFNTAVANITTVAPYQGAIYAYNPHLQLPYTLHWNTSIEQGLGSKQTLTISYVAAAGRRMLSSIYYDPSTLGNAAFSLGNGLTVAGNGASSDYNSLQVKFQRKLAKELQVLSSYVWSHSIDDATTNGGTNANRLERADSDLDIRHSFQTAVSYDLHGISGEGFVSDITRHWGLDTIFQASTAAPVDVMSGLSSVSQNGETINFHPNRVAGEPLYLHGSQYPGGRAINYNAFAVAYDGFGNPTEGNAGRNSARGFGAFQVDMAIHRSFALGERVALKFRAEAFNVFNHPQFGDIDNNLSDGQGTFGYVTDTRNVKYGNLSSLYQTGGPRSLQIALRLQF
jgi:hypothetical protein